MFLILTTLISTTESQIEMFELIFSIYTKTTTNDTTTSFIWLEIMFVISFKFIWSLISKLFMSIITFNTTTFTILVIRTTILSI